jgi:signal transduction histidine kinase
MSVTNDAKPKVGVPQRPLRRAAHNVVLGGVCAGIAVRLGVRERTIRVLACLSILALGLGGLAYVMCWLFTVRAGETTAIGHRLAAHRREAETFLLSVAISLLLLVALHSLDVHLFGVFAWTTLLSAVGLVFVWRGASPDERTQLSTLIGDTPYIGAASARGWRGVFLRVVPGVVLLVIGLNIVARIGSVWGAAIPGIVGGVAVLGGVLIILAPWWLQTARDLTRERRDRVRAEERASMAAHLHDSVLQTLTLIERAADNASEVVTLARAQERELRQWLFAPVSATDQSRPTSLKDRLAEVQSDVEATYGVRVDLVVVGDCPADDDIAALVAAGREALVNAANWSGATSVAVYAEVEPTLVSLFVRDLGCGFDPRTVAEDRHGIAQSIVARMTRHGGTATVRSAPSTGTEVAVTLPRKLA